jgi:hypothetical protein
MLSSHCSSSTPDLPGGSYVTAGQRGPVRQGAADLFVRRPSALFSHYHPKILHTCLAYCKYEWRECQQEPRCMRCEPVSCAGHQPIATTTHPGHPLQESTALVVDTCNRRKGRRNNIMRRSNKQGAMGPAAGGCRSPPGGLRDNIGTVACCADAVRPAEIQTLHHGLLERLHLVRPPAELSCQLLLSSNLLVHLRIASSTLQDKTSDTIKDSPAMPCQISVCCCGSL